MYGGRGATGVPNLPSPMNLAHVGCNGCHTVPTPVGRDEREFTGSSMIAVKAACEVCHGIGYSEMVGSWEKEINSALSLAQNVLDNVRASLGTDPEPDDQRTMEVADRNIRFVRFSVPVHNRKYALSILDKTVGDLKKLSGNSKQR